MAWHLAQRPGQRMGRMQRPAYRGCDPARMSAWRAGLRTSASEVPFCEGALLVSRAQGLTLASIACTLARLALPRPQLRSVHRCISIQTQRVAFPCRRSPQLSLRWFAAMPLLALPAGPLGLAVKLSAALLGAVLWTTGGNADEER